MQSEKIKNIEHYFKKRPEVVAVYLFGSYAKGKEKKYSDVDLGILLKYDCLYDQEKLNKLFLLDLSRLLRKDIHLVVMNNAGEGILAQIFKYGKCIVSNDSDALIRFKMVQYSMISDFAYYQENMQKSFLRNFSRQIND